MTKSSLWEPSALSRVEVDEVWKSLGRYGRYQTLQILTLMVAGLPMAYPVLSVVFEGVNNPHECRPRASFFEDNVITDNSSVTSESCLVKARPNNSDGREFLTTHCDGYRYDQPDHVSFVSEWDLVCSKAALAQVSQTLVMAGMFAGATLLSNLADRYGRKRSHVGCHVALFAASLAMAFMPNYVSFVSVKFFTGVFQQGYLIPLAIHLLELLPTEQRASMGVLGSLLWAVSVMSMSPIAYAMRAYSWRALQIVFAAFNAFCVVEIFFLDESLCWLVANHRFDSIRHVIQKAAKYNHRDPEVVVSNALNKSDAMRMPTKNTGVKAVLSSIPEVNEEEAELPEVKYEIDGIEQDLEKRRNGEVVERKHLQEEKQKEKEGEEEESDDFMSKIHQDGFLDLVKDPDMRFITLATLYIWMTNSLTYYGVTLLSSSMAGNFYLNFFLGGLLEIPSCCIMWLGLARIGRKKTMMAFISLAGVALLAASLVAALSGGGEAAGVAQTVLSMVARFGITGSFNAIWVYTPEIFPTNLRNVGVGISSSSARIGGMAAPFFNLLGTWRWVECQTLYDFNHLMIQAGIHYFMFGTTLLGSWRHHGLLPAEQNVQVAVSFDTRKDLKKILMSLEPDHVLQRVTPYRWMLLSREMPREMSSLVKRPVHIDINFYNLTDTHVLLSNPLVAKRGFAYPKDQVFPLTYRPFQGTHFPAPNDTMAVLMATYDLDLCEVAPCHDLVKTQESTCLEMPCEQLEEIYPFTRHEMNDDGCCEEFLIYHWRQINKVVLNQSREQC